MSGMFLILLCTFPFKYLKMKQIGTSFTQLWKVFQVVKAGNFLPKKSPLKLQSDASHIQRLHPVNFQVVTLPEANIFAPENRAKPNRKVLFQPSIFRCNLLVSGGVVLFFPGKVAGSHLVQIPFFCGGKFMILSGYPSWKLTYVSYHIPLHLRCFRRCFLLFSKVGYVTRVPVVS